MKRILAALMAVLLLLPFAACTKPAPEPVQNTGSPEQSGEEHGGEEGLTTAAPTAAPTEAPESHDAFDPETDADNRFANANGRVIETEDGLYFSSIFYDYLMFYDYGLEEMIPVCGKPDCEHFKDGNAANINRDCDAYIKGVRNPTLYEGKLYYVDDYGKPNPNDNGATLGNMLYRMEPDGTQKEFVMDLFPPEAMDPQFYVIHRGILYVSCIGSIVTDGEPKYLSSVIAAPLNGSVSDFRVLLELEDAGSIDFFFVGDDCYMKAKKVEIEYTDLITYDDYIVKSYELIITRWNSRTEELETVFDDCLPDGKYISDIWVTEDGTIYGASMEKVYRFEDGGFTELFSFEEPGFEFTTLHLSDGIVIGRAAAEEDWSYGSVLWWIRRFDGSTLYKGCLSTDWMDGVEEMFTDFSLIFFEGDETGIYLCAEFDWPVLDKMKKANRYLLRLDFTEDGIEEKLLGSLYYER